MLCGVGRRLQPQHVVTVLGAMINSTSTRIFSAVGQQQQQPQDGDVLHGASDASSSCLTAHCCAWLFGLLACLDSILAQQSSIASDLRLLFRLAVYERHQAAVALEQGQEQEESPPLTAERQRTAVAPANVLITVLSKFFKVGADLDEYV